MHEIVAAAAACGVSPIVRVVKGERWMIKRALDSGAHGILVPVIKTVEDARKVVQHSKFPPMGKCGFEPLLAVEIFVEQHPHSGKVKQLTGTEYVGFSAKWGLNSKEISHLSWEGIYQGD